MEFNHKDLEACGNFHSYKPMPYTHKAPDGWYENDLFQFGDYNGSVVTQANIRGLLEYLGGEKKVLSMWCENYYGIYEAMTTEPDMFAFVLRYMYNGECMILNMRSIAERDEDLYERIMHMNEYPCWDDELLSEVEEERVQESWNDYVCCDVLHLIHKELNLDDKDIDYSDWEDKVEEKFSKGELLAIFMSCDSDYANPGYAYIRHETGPNTYWDLQKQNSEGVYTSLTAPVLRVLNAVKDI